MQSNETMNICALIERLDITLEVIENGAYVFTDKDVDNAAAFLSSIKEAA